MNNIRTVQLYSYRQANALVQIENADVLQGGVWCADIGDPATCESCIAQHGTVYPVGTVCNDHYGGRCDILPWAIGAENPIKQNGESWFKEQPESRQQDILGKSKWEAWNSGKFEFSQLSAISSNEVYGEMRTAASLKSLIGEE